jgi:hypothetical protein
MNKYNIGELTVFGFSFLLQRTCSSTTEERCALCATPGGSEREDEGRVLTGAAL